MSTYYDYYIYVKRNNKYEYAGYYDSNGKPLPLYYHSRSSSWGFLNNGEYFNNLGEQGFYLKDDAREDEARFGYVFRLSDIQNIPDRSHKEAFVYKTLQRDIEINKLNIDIALIMDDGEESYDGKPLVICKSEYEVLSPDEKKDYFYHQWIDYEDQSYHRNQLCAIIDNWMFVREFYEFDGVDIRDIYVVAFES